MSGLINVYAHFFESATGQARRGDELDEYSLQQMHAHVPSEHTVNGQPAAAELHPKRDRAADHYWVATGWGRTSDWYRNALAHPPRLVDTGKVRLTSPAVTELDAAARLDLLRDYQQRNPRVAKALGERLLGAGFTDDEASLADLAEKLGVLRFSPGPGESAETRHRS